MQLFLLRKHPVKHVIEGKRKRRNFVIKTRKEMMTKEEVAEIMLYCKESGVSHKVRLEELEIPAWKFYESKRRYAWDEGKLQESGEFLQLKSDGSFVPTPSFAATTGRRPKEKSETDAKNVSVELRTPNGTMMRIRGDISQCLQAIIQAGIGHV